MPRIRHVIIATLLLLLIAPLLPRPAAAAPAAQVPGLTMQIAAGYDGNYKLGEWFPVAVTLANDGPSFTGRLEIDALGVDGRPVSTYAQDVDLPSPSRKALTLYSYSASFQRDFNVRLVHDNSVVLKQSIKLTPLEEPAFILGVIGDDPALLNGLNNESLGRVANTPTPTWSSSSGPVNSSARTTVAHLALDTIPPSALGLSGLDALVLAGVDSSKLSPEQVEAVNGWIVRGGALVVGGGPDAAITAAAFTTILPVQLRDSKQAGDFAALAAYAASKESLTGNAVVAVGDPTPGSSVDVVGAEVALLARRSLGLGQVIFMALDPGLAPLKGWDGTADLYDRIFASQDVGLSAGGWRRIQQSYGWPSYDSYGTPFDVPSLDLPSVGLVGLFLLVYIAIVGPLNFIILRRRGRSELAWVTIPVLILLFAVGAYAFGRSSRGANLYLTQGNVIHAYAGANIAAVDSFVGLFSPDRREYDVTFGSGESAVTEVGPQGYGLSNVASPATVYSGKPSHVDDLNLNTWSLRGFLAESTIPYNTPYEASLTIKNNHVVGTVKNLSQNNLTDVAVFSGSNLQRVGDLGAGQTTQIDMTLGYSGSSADITRKMFPGLPQYSWSGSGNTAAEREIMRRATIFTSALYDDDISTDSRPHVTIVGWGAPSPLPVQIAGTDPQRDELNLVITTLPLELGTGQVELPSGLVPRHIVSGGVDQTNPGDGMQVSLASVIFGYTLPSDLKVDSLTLHYDVGQLYSDLSAFVYNWQTSSWDEIKKGNGTLLHNYSSNGAVDISPANHITPDGEVQLRLGKDDSYYTTVMVRQFDLSAKGTK